MNSLSGGDWFRFADSRSRNKFVPAAPPPFHGGNTMRGITFDCGFI
jgi:hypothetical protein